MVTSSPVWLGSYPRVEDRYGSPEGNRRGSGLFGESFAWTIRTMTSRSLWPVVTAGYFYIDILARAAARGRRPEGCGAGSYRPNGPIGPLPKPKFGRGDGRLEDRPAVAPSGWRETAVPMRGHRHHSRIGRANALTGRHARPSCPSSWPPASQHRGFSSLPHDHAWPAHLFSGPTTSSDMFVY